MLTPAADYDCHFHPMARRGVALLKKAQVERIQRLNGRHRLALKA